MTCFKNKNSVKPDENTPAHKQERRRDRDSGAGNTDACNSSNNNRRGRKNNGRLFSTTLSSLTFPCRHICVYPQLQAI